MIDDDAKYILNNISCSKLFIGVEGIDLEYGLTTTSLEEAELKKKMLKAAQKVIILADSSKSPLDRIDYIIWSRLY